MSTEFENFNAFSEYSQFFHFILLCTFFQLLIISFLGKSTDGALFVPPPSLRASLIFIAHAATPCVSRVSRSSLSQQNEAQKLIAAYLPHVGTWWLTNCDVVCIWAAEKKVHRLARQTDSA